MSRLGPWFHRLSNPHPVIEYILAGIVLLGTVVVLVGESPTVDGINITTAGDLISQYPLLQTGFLLMSVVALVHLAFLSVYPPTGTSVWWRTRALSAYVIGFMYVAVLEVTTFGFDNLLWVNEFGIALIAAVLHLNLKVRSPDAN
jgi:hypothetical protein